MPKAPLHETQHSAEIQWKMALQNFSKKLYNRAMLNIREAIHHNPDYLKAAQEQFNRYSRTGESEKAIAVGLALVEFDPKNDRLLNQIGNAYRKRGDYAKAQKMYHGAWKANPKYEHARYNMAACHFKVATMDENLVQQTRMVEQFVIFRRMGYQLAYEDSIPTVENQPMPSRLQANSQIAVHETDTEAAEMWIPAFEERAKANPQSWQHQFDLAVLYDVARFGALALQSYHHANALFPHSNTIETNLGVAYAVYQQNYEKTKDLFLGILRRDPCDRTTLLNMAIYYRLLKKPFSMLQYYAYVGELLVKSHGFFQLDEMIQAADASYERQQRNKALDLYQSLLEEKKNPHWLYRMGMIYKYKRQTKQALHHWKQALAIDPTHPESQQELMEYAESLEAEAQDLWDDNFLTDAAELLEQAFSVYPNPTACELLADIYEELGEKERADQFAQHAQQMSQ